MTIGLFLTLAVAIDLTVHVLVTRSENARNAEEHFRSIEFRHV